MTDAQQRAAAKAFAKNWKDRGYEKGDSQIFWVELLTTVFGVTEISQFISFEDQGRNLTFYHYLIKISA